MSRTLLSSEQLEPIFQEMLHDESKIVKNWLIVRNWLRMLRINYQSLNHEISLIKLGEPLGYDVDIVHFQYDRFAQELCKRTGFTPMENYRNGSTAWPWAICEYIPKESKGSSQWRLRPEVVKAIQRLSLFDDHDLLDDIAAKDQEYKDLPAKDREAVVKARIGQGRFRQELVKHWSKTCAVTGCDALDLLIASHIKPWRECTSTETLDVNNGLLLIPSLDAAFDKGYITFNDEGHLLMSPRLSDNAKKCLGISAEMRLAHVSPQHREYLLFHRLNVFNKTA